VIEMSTNDDTCDNCGHVGLEFSRDMGNAGYFCGECGKFAQAEKVEDSGSEADFGTKDKQESWEERFDHNFTGTANIITDFKAYVKSEIQETEKRVSELERNKPVTFADLTIETKMIDMSEQAEKVEDKSWEDEFKTKMHYPCERVGGECNICPETQCYYKDQIKFIKSLLETEKQKAVEEVFDILITDYYDGISTVDGLREKLKAKYKE